MKTPGDQRPHCPACGLHEPCKTCGKPGPRLAVVPTERLYTREEIRVACLNAGGAGPDESGPVWIAPADLLQALP